VKKVLGWIKTHLVIVICTIVIPASLVSGWIFSSGWNEKIRTGQAQRANNAYNKIKSAKVTYVIPSLLPGEQAWSESRAPNAVFTELVRLEREKRLGSAGGIVGEVESFNRRDHGLLEPSLLPAPGNPQQETRLKYSMLAQVAGDEQLGEKSIYLDLFASIGAGDPPDPLKLATNLQDLRDRETDRTMDESGASSLTVEQQEVLDKLLSDRRIAEAPRRYRSTPAWRRLTTWATATRPPRSRRSHATIGAQTSHRHSTRRSGGTLITGWSATCWPRSIGPTPTLAARGQTSSTRRSSGSSGSQSRRYR
jgi:hypothetical protein